MPDEMREAWKDIGQPPIVERLHRLSEALGRLAEGSDKHISVNLTVVIGTTHISNDPITTNLEQAVLEVEQRLAAYVADLTASAEAQLVGAQLTLDNYRRWAHALRAARTILPEPPPVEEQEELAEDDIPF